MTSQVNQDLQQHKPLLDTLTSYVTLCTGYELVGVEGKLICAEFRYSGGRFPMALDPDAPIPHNVELIERVVQLHVFMDRLPKLNLSLLLAPK